MLAYDDAQKIFEFIRGTNPVHLGILSGVLNHIATLPDSQPLPILPTDIEVIIEGKQEKVKDIQLESSLDKDSYPIRILYIPSKKGLYIGDINSNTFFAWYAFLAGVCSQLCKDLNDTEHFNYKAVAQLLNNLENFCKNNNLDDKDSYKNRILSVSDFIGEYLLPLGYFFSDFGKFVKSSENVEIERKETELEFDSGKKKVTFYGLKNSERKFGNLFNLAKIEGENTIFISKNLDFTDLNRLVSDLNKIMAIFGASLPENFSKVTKDMEKMKVFLKELSEKIFS